VFRFMAEYFREPDSHLGYLALHMSMGQWLCVPMIVGGGVMVWLAQRGFWKAAPT
jgi:phosphatidylglycerol:prolipoprotein diacylglycerol transferase